ncbi:Glycosyltransferase involved in cell wall bisynthesis [Rhizobiales bacterium GAS191]|jgi:glycosyltransferase involved in cell wall biosynthesis|nr:Glycosyltransferase involved in cell wall bisynthesis [Rhizobiales bacterium GAS113]SEC04591.1 Glycosyltransferase involved in cell wall bisynthesis [Rhizobiales bacterium GAS191]SED14914.1 Glycosyltransferase involved in cell wall bisynthesis [Rhizobiales bacterium GAS188]
MRIAIATTQVPFLRGGAEIHAASLRHELELRGIEADIVSIPFKWYPPARLLDAMLMARLVDLSAVNGQPIDRVITLKFPAYYIEHACKIGWVLHQHRQAYDLFETPFGDLHHDAEGRAVAAEIRKWDERYLPEHRALFANSRVVRDRLERHNGIRSEVLYHPPASAERYRCAGFEPFILAPGRLDPMKRQLLALDAFRSLPPEVRLVLIGPSTGPYGDAVSAAAQALGPHRIIMRGIVSEAEKLDLYARCLGVYNGVYDEDYGYVTLEAFLAGKPVITHTDSGGPLEFVRDGENGFVVPPAGAEIAAAIARLAARPALAQELGDAGRRLLAALGIDWDKIIARLVA